MHCPLSYSQAARCGRFVRHARGWTACALCGLWLCLIGCSGSDEPQTPIQKVVERAETTDAKVLLIGIDGATFAVIDSMIEAGRLPVMASLMRGGARGTLTSEEPMLSPALWTSIATGRRRTEHGIHTFLRRGHKGDKKILVTSNDRRVSALWNWLGPFGKTVGVVGWWATWPAEPVNGWVVSDRITRSRWNEWRNGRRSEHLTFPSALMDELWPLVIEPDAVPVDEIASMADFTPDELDQLRRSPTPVMGHALSSLKFSYCSQRTYEEIATHLLDREQPDVTAVFLIATDPISHTFWHFYEPSAFDGVDPDDAARLGSVIPSIYEHNDRFIGRLLDIVDDRTHVIVVSDHGFRASGQLPQAANSEQLDELRALAEERGEVTVGQSGGHDLGGVFIASGPYIRSGVTVSATIYDVAPTILALMGMPVPDVADGRVLREILDPDFLEEHPVRPITSYDDYIDRQKLAVPSEDDEEILEQLRALGYIK